MIFKLKQENGGKLRILLPKPDERRKKVKVVVGEWDKNLKSLAGKSEIVILSQPHKLKTSRRKGAFFIKGPGEYEVQGVFVKGIEDSADGPIYVIRGEDKRMAYLPCPSNLKKELETSVLDEMGAVDLLVIEFDWNNLPRSKNLKGVISQIEPSIIVFMDGGSQKKAGKLLKKMDVKKFESEEEIVLNTTDFKEDKKIYYVLRG